jgi:DNA-binding ferritin-like protein
MNEWNNLLFLNEADDEEEKKSKDDDKKEEDKKESEKKDDEKDSDDEYNDLMGDDDEYNDLMGDDDDVSDDSEDSDEGDYNTLLVVQTDSDSDSDGGLYEKAAKAAYAFVVISNNMKHVHLNVCGEKFEEVHRLCDELYNHFAYTADTYYELAAESPLITLDNPTRAKEHCEDISVEMEREYNFRQALEVITSNIDLGIKYLSDLRDASDTRKDIQSKVDEEIGYLNKQSRYFIRKRLCGYDSETVKDKVELESYDYYNDIL